MSPGPFVLNLCSSTTPLALAQTDLPELKRFTFFVSRRFEEGRERFRLHMGYFATLAEAEEWLGVVREIYPGAWAGEAPGRKLRERAAAAAAAQAQHAVGPQRHAPPVPAARNPAPPAASPPPQPAAAQPPAVRVPVVHAAPPVAVRPIASVPSPSAPPAARAPAAQPPAAVQRRATPVARIPAPVPAPVPAATPARAAAAPSAPPAPAPLPAKRAAKGVFEDSNVREVLKALSDSSPTGETRLMRAPPPQREAPAEGSALSDTQVLRMLEARRPEGSEPLAAEAGGGIPLLKPDDTGTRRALKEAVTSNAPVAFAVQLQWSVQPVELGKVPPLAIFGAYTLYTVEGSRDGRKWYGLRLGFFSDAISAKQVAHYVRSEFASVAVVPVSPQEKARATDQEQAATLAAPPASRSARSEEFKLIDDQGAAPPSVPAPAAAPRDKPMPRVAVGRSVRQSATAPRARTRGGARVGARDKRGPQTLEETLEILGAHELSIDNGTGETLNDSGVRHLRVQVQKNSPFAKLLERLSERVKKT